MLKNKKGFTLNELMAVVLIIGILASIAIPSYRTSVEKAKIVNNMALMNALQNDIVNYYNLHGSLPTKLTQLSINKNEFKDLTNTSGTHIPTNCTFSLGTTQKKGISMSCGQGWVMMYNVESTGIGYIAGKRAIQAATADPNTIRKIAAGFNWPADPDLENTYIIQ